MTRYRYDLLVVSAVCLALGLGAPAEAAKSEKQKKQHAASHSTKQRNATANRSRTSSGNVPLYNGQDYIGQDPDPNIRSYLIRDMTRYGGQD